MFKAKTSMIEPNSEASASEVFAVSDNITPIAVASVDEILKLNDVEDLQVVPERKVQQLIIQNKPSNPLSKFFVRLGTHLDSIEEFLNELSKNYVDSIEQKKVLYQSDSSDQKQRTQRAKRTARRLAAERAASVFNRVLSDKDSAGVLSVLAASFLDYTSGQDDDPQTIKIVPYQPVAGQLESKGKTDPNKGKLGWMSGYEITSGYGMRWGRMHGGVDVGVPVGTMFALKKDAIIKYAGWQDPNDQSKGYGLLVDAWVPDLNKMFRFGHLSSMAVKEGDTVKAGEVMGKSGNTGKSTGPHFHIEVHNTVTASYGGINPMPFMDYVIAGDIVKQQAEGSIERVGRVMVGEAGAEFVIPMSQMPIFTQLVMEEKIKSLNPYFQPEYGRFDDIGFKRGEGYANDKMAAGGITINNNHRIAAKRLTSYFPTAEPIHIAAAMGNFETEAPGLKPDTYQWYGGPGRGIAQWETPGRWDTAVKMYGPNVINSLENQLKFVKWEMDTAHVINGSPNLPWGYAAKKEWLKSDDISSATENFMEGYESPGVPHWTQRLANAVYFLDQMPTMLGKPKTPPVPPTATSDEVQKQIEKNLRDRNTMSPEDFFGTKPVFSSSLNSIPGNEQMQIANETQEQFSFDNVKGEIVALYQPTVYYSES